MGFGAANNSQDFHKIMLGIRQQVELEEVEEVTPGGPPDMHDHIIAKTPEEKL